MSVTQSCRKGAVAAALVLMALSPAIAMDKIPDEYKINGFAVGCQAWSFSNRAFTVFDAIKLTHEAGGKVIEFFPGQALSPDHRDIHFGHTSPDDVIAEVQEECKKYDVLAVNYGVVTPSGSTADERKGEWRQIFEFAKKMNLYGVTSEPRAEDMDTIEQLVKEFDIHFSIHDHPKRSNDPSYRFWDPNYVLSLVKDRDPRMGSCADTGHWLTSGVDPVEALRILKGRVISSHMKDRDKKGPGARDVAWGSGVGEIKQILNELKAQNFQGNIDIEYESDMGPNADGTAPKSYPAIKESIAWIRDHYEHTARR